MVMCYSSPRKLPHEGSGEGKGEEGELPSLAKVHVPPSPGSCMTQFPSFCPSFTALQHQRLPRHSWSVPAHSHLKVFVLAVPSA